MRTRKTLLLVFALCAFFGSLVATLATIQQRDFELRGYVDATRTQQLPFRMARLGVNVELLQYTPDELSQHLELMLTAHIAWIRQPVRWDEIEPVQGQYNWVKLDEVITALDDYPDLELVVVLGNTPQWARSDGASGFPSSAPADPTIFAEFARVFAARYGQSVNYYQIWDEPNLYEAWGRTNPNAADYAALLQESYQAIHAADANATVIAAALAPTTESGPENISDLIYLRDLYEYGAADFSDAFAGKPYGFDFSPADRTFDADLLSFSRIVALREIMMDYGDGKKALWASNWGWNSLPENWAGSSSDWGGVSTEEQQQFTSQALDRAEREWPWLGGMILHHWQPDMPTDDPQWGFAVIGQDGEPTELWDTLVNYDPSESATNGLFASRNPYARYSGTWVFSEFGADIGWTQDSRLEFDFTGSDVALLLREDNDDGYVAHLYPTIDGVPPGAVPKDIAGNSYILLRSETTKPELSLVPVARGLDDTSHTLQVIANELNPGENNKRWPLIGYAVSSGDLTEPYDTQITIAWITAFVSALAMIATGWQINWKKSTQRLDIFWNIFGEAGQIVLSVVASLALMGSMLLTWYDGMPTVFRRDSVQIVLSMITAGFVYINEFGVVLTLFAILVLFVIIYKRLELGLMLIIFWSPFFLFPIELYRFAFPVAEVILLITFMSWIANLVVGWAHDRQNDIGYYPGTPILTSLLYKLTLIDYLMIAWVVLGLVSLTWAKLPSVAITELRVMILQPAIFYAVLRTISCNRKTMILLVDTLLFAGFAISVIGLFMWFRGDSIITAEEGARRLTSVYGSPNNVGLILGRCIPFAMAMVLIKVDQKRAIIAGVILLVMTVTVVLTKSAGAIFVGVPFAVAGILILVYRRRAARPLAIMLVISVIGLVIAFQSPRFTRLIDFSEGTTFSRLRIWQSSLNMISDQPLTGVGLDQFLYEYRGKYILPDAWEEPDISHPHNVILDFWTRLGIMGVLLFIAIQIEFWRNTYNKYKKYLLDDDRLILAITVGLMGSMLNLLAHGLVDNSVYVLDLVYVFVLMLGLMSILSNIGAIDEA
jgi:O-antigen ligase